MEDLTDNNATEDNNKGEMEIDSDSTSEAEETQDDASASDDQQPAEDDMESMMDMYEESFKRFAEGEVVTGHIISIDKDHVLVDIGYKSEGQIKINEFMDDSGSIQANIDDPVEVAVRPLTIGEHCAHRRVGTEIVAIPRDGGGVLGWATGGAGEGASHGRRLPA